MRTERSSRARKLVEVAEAVAPWLMLTPRRMLAIHEQIWNRALGASVGGAELRAGDRALAAALLAHGIVMNGGVLHALQGMGPSERREAAAGYRFLALPTLAELFEMEVPDGGLDDDEEDDADVDGESELDRLEAELNQKYWATAPEDDALWRAFEKKLMQEPGLFAPVPR
jgi:hypothetical protein